MSRLLYIRHAQASYGAADYDQLSEKGYEQASILGQHLAKSGVELHNIYVGPLKRQNQTLDKVREAYSNAGIQLPDHTTLKELEEHRGPDILKSAMNSIVTEDELIRGWEAERKADPSLNIKKGLLIFERAMLLWATGKLSHHQPEHYLDWPSFRAQAKRGFEDVFARHKHENKKTIALFTSGGTISATLGHVLGMEHEKDIIGMNGIVQNTSITEFLFSGDRITMKRFNDVSHLPENMKTYV